MHSEKVYSFDIFDTCLARLCGEPQALIDVLSKKVVSLSQESGNEYFRQLFVAARIGASGNTLDEIYSNVSNDFPLPCSSKQMAELEMETEKEMIVPILTTSLLISKYRAKGRIMFISDMYLSSAFLRDRLREYGFFKEGDTLYVSNESRASKFDGSLFKLIHKIEGIPYRRWHHFGDNQRSDYRVPRRLGIHAHHLHYDYLSYEDDWRSMSTHNYPFPAIFAGISRSIRLSNSAPSWQSAFVCDVSGPFMIMWVIKVMKDAQIRGIKRLFFCSRDAHSEYQIAKRLQTLFPGMDVSYLFVSRDALYNNCLAWEYLKSIGFVSDVPSAIVDSSSTGKTLSFINNLLINRGYRPIRGYYIINVSTASSFNSAFRDTSFYSWEMVSSYLDSSTIRKVRALSGMLALYEHVFSLNFHPKVKGYEYHGDAIRPVFEKDYNDYWYFKGDDVRAMKRANDSCLIEMTKATQLTGLLDFSETILEIIALPTLVNFISYPSKYYLNYLNRFVIWGQPFVEKISRRPKGLWKRGNICFSLPFLSGLSRTLLLFPGLRRAVHRAASIIK